MVFWKKIYKSRHTGAEIDAAVDKAGILPSVSGTDEGKVLMVDGEGKIVAGEASGGGSAAETMVPQQTVTLDNYGEATLSDINLRGNYRNYAGETATVVFNGTTYSDVPIEWTFPYAVTIGDWNGGGTSEYPFRIKLSNNVTTLYATENSTVTIKVTTDFSAPYSPNILIPVSITATGVSSTTAYYYDKYGRLVNETLANPFTAYVPVFTNDVNSFIILGSVCTLELAAPYTLTATLTDTTGQYFSATVLENETKMHQEICIEHTGTINFPIEGSLSIAITR